MFKRDCTEISEHALASPEGLYDVIEFTLCTIQAALSGCIKQRMDIEKVGFGSRFLWGSKREGCKQASAKRVILWSKLGKLREERGKDDIEAITEGILLLAKLPNLGMVKAAFIMQMLGFNVACLDSHNLKRLRLSTNFTRLPASLSTAKKRERIAEYVQLTQAKGSEYWWNSWCEHVAGNLGNKDLDTPELVSRFHVHCVKLHVK